MSMMSPSGIRAGAAYIELFVKDKLQVGLQLAERRLRQFATNMNHVGRTLVATGVAAGMPLAIGLRSFVAFESAMAEVKAITGAVGDDFEALTEKARKLGRDTSFTATEVASAMVYLARAGYTVDQVLASVRHTLDLARAGNVDLAFAADVATDIAQAFKIPAEEVDRVIDVIAGAAASANTDVEKMGQSFKFAAALAAEAGQDLETMAAGIGALGNAGIKATTAGTDMALIMKRLIEPDVKRNLKKLGVDPVNEMTGSMKQLNVIWRQLMVALKGKTPVERMDFMAQNFDRAAKSALSLMSQVDTFDILVEKMWKTTGAANAMAKIMDDTVLGAWRQFKSSMEDVAITVGYQLNEALKNLLMKLRDIANKVNQWAASAPKLTKAIVILVASFLGLGVSLILLSLMVKLFTFALGTVGKLIMFIMLLGAKILFALAPLVSLKGLLAIIMVLVAAMLIKFTGAGRAMADAWNAAMTRIKSDWGETFKAIGDALYGGDLALAWEIFCNTLVLTWKRAALEIAKTWQGLKYNVSTIYDQLVTHVAVGLGRTWADILTLWEKIKFMTTPEKIAIVRDETTGEVRRINLSVQEYNKNLEEIANLRKSIDQLYDDQKNRDKKKFEAGAKEIAEAEKDVVEYEKKLTELRDKAARLAAEEAGKKEDEMYWSDRKRKLEDEAKARAAAAPDVGETFGTFSSPGALRFGTLGGASKRQLEELEKIRELTRREMELMRRLILTFTS